MKNYCQGVRLRKKENEEKRQISVGATGPGGGGEGFAFKRITFKNIEGERGTAPFKGTADMDPFSYWAWRTGDKGKKGFKIVTTERQSKA